jgi:hypothetical protein
MIKRIIQFYKGEVLFHKYQIGNNYDDSITISYFYINNKPIQATLSYRLDFPTINLEEVLKGIIEYSYSEINTINIFNFDDNSHINLEHPIYLGFFHIAYHGKTWYEANFNAKMIDSEKYERYKNSLNFLTDSLQKPEFMDFLNIIRGSLQSTKNLDTLEIYYNKSSTYREFFENIPKTRRYEILHEWLATFMEYYIGSVFSVKGWYIDVNDMSRHCQINYEIFSFKKMSNF